ncbi:hypothetical protein J6590_011290 [Homalodisca vitripennis]|nr:hypothetical protein J6590_011290 [Homalodisca vitripennis]
MYLIEVRGFIAKAALRLFTRLHRECVEVTITQSNNGSKLVFDLASIIPPHSSSRSPVRECVEVTITQSNNGSKLVFDLGINYTAAQQFQIPSQVNNSIIAKAALRLFTRLHRQCVEVTITQSNNGSKLVFDLASINAAQQFQIPSQSNNGSKLVFDLASINAAQQFQIPSQVNNSIIAKAALRLFTRLHRECVEATITQSNNGSKLVFDLASINAAQQFQIPSQVNSSIIAKAALRLFTRLHRQCVEATITQSNNGSKLVFDLASINAAQQFQIPSQVNSSIIAKAALRLFTRLHRQCVEATITQSNNGSKLVFDLVSINAAQQFQIPSQVNSSIIAKAALRLFTRLHRECVEATITQSNNGSKLVFELASINAAQQFQIPSQVNSSIIAKAVLRLFIRLHRQCVEATITQSNNGSKLVFDLVSINAAQQPEILSQKAGYNVFSHHLMCPAKISPRLRHFKKKFIQHGFSRKSEHDIDIRSSRLEWREIGTEG